MVDYCKRIKNILNLRDPQTESLRVFQKICDTISFQKSPFSFEELAVEFENEIAQIMDSLKEKDFLNAKMGEKTADFFKDDLEKVQAVYPTLTSFEREFPSICFALATGIGKTRLMGAMIAYLHYAKGINNFFVMAPNLTIYNKLKDDFGKPSHSKYVFRGLDAFVTPPRIIDGDSYENFRQLEMGHSKITINIFNISKLNSDTTIPTRGKDVGKSARIKRLNEILGESYFDYLKNLDDLCIFMDESHHYHAEKSFEVINELKPVLGVEVTATPQTQKGAKAIPFKNVVYEYSLAHALNDEKYIKIPAVVTRKDFKPDQYTPEDLDKEKLFDGIKLHIDTQDALNLYARANNKKVIKPFVLVVAKDTDHSKHIREFLASSDFYRGKYKDKILEINSAQKGIEKNENIETLLKLEDDNNVIEIVIHVNMLKEGWDVTNLYTIIPLRASASETLTEQTIGRGLRLPYGERTGVDEVDRLSIVSHDRYQDIIKLANDENSLVRKVYLIDSEENPTGENKTQVELTSSYEDTISSNTYTKQLTFLLPEIQTQKPEDADIIKENIAKFIAKTTGAIVQELHKQVKNINEVNSEEMQKIIKTAVVSETKKAFPELQLQEETILPCIEKASEFSAQSLTTKAIPIPQGTVQPISETKLRYDMFTLDVRAINFQTTDETLVGTELREGGKTYDIDVAHAGITVKDSPENAIAKFIIAKDNIDYVKAADVIYDLIKQLKEHLYSYLHTDEAVDKVLKQRRKNLAENLYTQINEHFYKEETVYTISNMRPFSEIEIGFANKFESDKIYDLRDNIVPSEIKKRIFTGFKKACHTMYKFDSTTEKTFATVLEDDKSVLRWLCPSEKQFSLYYDKNSNARYQPDFIVELENEIYMVETKDSRMLKDTVVGAKAKAGVKYCASATEFNLDNGGKPWKYVLIPHDEVSLNSSFMGTVNNAVLDRQTTL